MKSGEIMGKLYLLTGDYILNSNNKSDNIHLAIVSDEDEYMGTVSLKSIDKNKRFKPN